jgi:hypothetical protein
MSWSAVRIESFENTSGFMCTFLIVLRLFHVFLAVLSALKPTNLLYSQIYLLGTLLFFTPQSVRGCTASCRPRSPRITLFQVLTSANYPNRHTRQDILILVFGRYFFTVQYSPEGRIELVVASTRPALLPPRSGFLAGQSRTTFRDICGPLGGPDGC